ncbi:DUF4344 domain-containing metallopeptidase [Nonomuraea spiralis]|uniref:DUF4344 domain-containing metallopeptidase n=1 Tax=Nonomuraea spiralis TaxID=46182 RepID=A0ABV5IRR4_9ACTN|nr:DUF4344 domain-containing metallopeptidase [Nonomuraea spiralis]
MMKWNQLTMGAGALLLTTMLSACGGTEQPVAAKEEAPKATQAAGGKFVAEYGEADTDLAAEGLRLLKPGKVLEGFAASLNGMLVLPYDVTLAGEQCGEVNAYYSPDEKKITMCYELVADGFSRYRDKAGTEEENDEHGQANLVDTLYHELGHAVIDLYDLPALGKEDDAADQLSAFMMSQNDDDSASVQTINYYFSSAGDQDRAALPFYDEHSMDEQRAFNYMCWIYGSDPKAYADWVGEDGLPEGRAAKCPAEYEKLANSWTKLLEPHIKD